MLPEFPFNCQNMHDRRPVHGPVCEPFLPPPSQRLFRAAASATRYQVYIQAEFLVHIPDNTRHIRSSLLAG